MPAKSKSKKIPAKTPSQVSSALEAPHPQVLPQAAATPPAEVPVVSKDLEEMLENDGDESKMEQKNKILFGAGALVTIGIIVATIGIFAIFLQTPKLKKEQSINQEAAVTPKPMPVFAPADIAFEVLNGSGVAGAAAKGAARLTSRGYTVLKTGNTKKQSNTEVFISSSLSEAQVRRLIVDLSVEFGIGSSSGVLHDSTASARLILGSK